jgi:hypothetical protein
MATIVEYPRIVQEAVAVYGDLFANDAQRRHFAEYVTGLLLAERKTVLGIHREFADIADQSCLNRFLTQVAWDVQALNEQRLTDLQTDASTRYSDRGVIPIDNVLIDHDGQYIQDAGWFWDHAEDRYKIAHDYLFINYVCTSGKHYPLDFRRFQKRDLCFCLGQPFKDHTELCCDLIDWVCAHDIPGTFTFDSYFTNAPTLNHLHGKTGPNGRPRGYVGDLKFNRKVEWKGQLWKVSALATTIPAASKRLVQIGARRQWAFTCTLHIPDVKHKVRLVILWDERQDSQAAKILVTNQVCWDVVRILLVYRYRWTGTETFHRDGKQQLGMGDCQLLDGQGQTRHMYLVMVAYSLLMKQLKQARAYEWAYQRLMTIGQACRAVMCETLRKTLHWAVTQIQDKAQTLQQVFVRLKLMGDIAEPEFQPV